MAKPVWVFVMLVAGTLLLWGNSARPAESPPYVGERITYLGPVSFQDPRDPLFAVRWTLGNTRPRRLSLKLPPRLALDQRVLYDQDRRRVLITYRAGSEEILPPLAYLPQEYPAIAFHRGFREEWVSGTKNVLTESRARGGAPDGLIDLTLPVQMPGFTTKLFGEGAPNLRVRGSEQITISGSSSWVVGQVTGEQGGNSLFPKLDMRQRLNVNLDGTIGSKLSVSMAQNSDALTPLENSVKIRYKGDDDEILRAVELGNTSLSLPSTQFVSFSARQEGLFGVKTEAQVGPIEMTAIASREQGQAGQVTFDGGASSKSVRVPDYNFSFGKYFYLVDPLGDVPAPDPNDITEIRLYLDNKDYRDDVERGAQPGRVWLDPAVNTPAEPATGNFHLLIEETDYQYYSDRLYGLPFIALTTQLSENQTLAIAYRQVTDGITTVVGDLDTTAVDTLDLKMLRPSQDDWGKNELTQSEWAPVRNLEAKNIYYLGVREIEAGSLSLEIVRDVAGADGNNPITLRSEEQQKDFSLLQVLGLDQKNNANPSQRSPDGKVDAEYIDLENGLLFFPDLRPFDPDLVDIEGNPLWREKSWPRGSDTTERPDTLGYTKDPDSGAAIPSTAEIRNRETVPEVYDLLRQYLIATWSDYHVYSIQAEVKAAVSNVIELNQLGGILEGSETVRLNGQELRRGEDYTIVYDTGQVTLKNPAAMLPGADLMITYSQDAIFARGSQSLIGASVSTRRDPNAPLSLSTTWLHQSKGVPDQRPRLRGEPTKTSVGDFAGRLKLEPWALTDLVDALPLVKANQPSRVELTGAMGVSFPNPNTKGEVFIDDMEGSEETQSPGMTRASWIYSSAPVRGLDYSTVDTMATAPLAIAPLPEDRGSLLWFNPNNVQVEDVTPREDSDVQSNDQVTALEVVYAPSDSSDAVGGWGGLTTSLGLVDISKYQFLEVWVNDYVPFELENLRRGEILIDVGAVSEDAVWDPLTPPLPPNRTLDYEDRNRDGDRPQVGEDTGLDVLFNGQEPPRPPGTTSFGHKDAASDPAGDDVLTEVETDLPEATMSQRIQKYRGINGTEENDRLNSEDLDADFELDDTNAYREYRINLADPAEIDNRRDYPGRPQDPLSGWRLYRIPLNSYHLDEGDVNLTQVKHLRMWFRGMAPGDTLNVQVASVELVGNRWELADTSRATPLELFTVGVVNNKENADYVAPFEVRRIDNQTEREQSITLEFENLQPGSDLRAYRRLQNTDDYTLYQSVSYYVNPRFLDIPNDTLEFYIRFGSDAATDTLSYYEISTPISEFDSRRRSDGWIPLTFDVDRMTSLKLADIPSGQKQDIGNRQSAVVVGNPSLSRVRRLGVGVRNINPHTLSRGVVWFDEFRMGDVRRDMGWATRGAANITLSDLAVVQASVDVQNPDFLRLGESRGSGMQNVRYDVRGQMALHKFMEPTGIIAPVSGRISQSTQTPKFVPNNDVLYDGPSSGAAITKLVDRGVDLTLSRTPRGVGSPILRYTVDAIRLSGGYAETFRNDVTRADSTRSVRGNANYNLNLGQIRPFRPLGLMSFWLWPKNVALGLTGSRQTTRVWNPIVGQDTLNTETRVLTTNTLNKTGVLSVGTTLQPISGLNYNYNSERDLIDEHYGPDSSVVRRDNASLSLLGLDLGRQVTENHALSFNYTPPLLGRALSPRFTWSGSSTQNLRPELTLEDYGNAVFNISNTDNASLSISVPLGRTLDKIFGVPSSPPRGGTPPKAPRRGAGADSAQATKPASEASPGKLFTKILRFKDVQATGSLGHRSAYSQIHGSPSWEYRLGFTRDIKVGEDVFLEPEASFNNAIGKTTSIRGTTSLTVFGQVGVDMTFQKRNDRSVTNGRVGRVTDDITWPEVRFDWGNLQERIPIIRKVFSDFRAVNTSYSRNTRTSGTLDNPKEETAVTTNWRPLVSIQGTLPGGWQGTMNANMSATDTRSDRLGSASTTSRRTTNSYQLTLNKKFLGIGGNASRDVDLKVDVTYSNNNSEIRSSYTDHVQEDRRDQFRFNGSAGLRLTRALTGTFGLELGQERRPTTDWTRRSVRVYFNTGFNF